MSFWKNADKLNKYCQNKKWSAGGKKKIFSSYRKINFRENMPRFDVFIFLCTAIYLMEQKNIPYLYNKKFRKFNHFNERISDERIQLLVLNNLLAIQNKNSNLFPTFNFTIPEEEKKKLYEFKEIVRRTIEPALLFKKKEGEG